MPAKLGEIVKNNRLMIDQAGKLEIETMLILLGIEPLEKYIKNLIDNVGLSNVQASVVAHDVNQLIFKNIRDTLKKINEDIKKEEGILEEKEQTSTEENIQNKESKKEEVHKEMSDMGIELRENTLPEIAPKIDVPMVSNTQKAVESLHQNVSPIKNIVETKMTETVTTPKKEIVIEE
ncbi:MAG TPA: hypothetical protein PLS91_01600, partial [Candidatus Paceibacterota bacterium]|nr:hypothetical protein [Candidatus Paceibacterota bacterium]